ncbi:MAG: hypothetical protein ABI349_04525, partial [Casimicrobiaceae bacterium]
FERERLWAIGEISGRDRATRIRPIRDRGENLFDDTNGGRTIGFPIRLSERREMSASKPVRSVLSTTGRAGGGGPIAIIVVLRATYAPGAIATASARRPARCNVFPEGGILN